MWRITQVALCLAALGQTSCLLVGYDGIRGVPMTHDSDAGTSEAGSLPDADSAPSDQGGSDGAVDDASDAGPADGDGVDAALGGDGVPDAAGGLVPLPNSGDATTPTSATEADAGSTAAPDAGAHACLGVQALGLCWHLGGFGLSCDQACDTYYGGFDPRTILYTGEPREGGSLANCQAVLLALGINANAIPSHRMDGLGLGCHVWNTGAAYWIDDQQPGPFDSGDSYFAARRVCACAY